jgi:hypothetical protein
MKMDTLEILNEAGRRAELLASSEDTEPDTFFDSIGLTDGETVADYCTHHAYEIFKVHMALGHGVSIQDVSTMSLLYGIIVGYQIALIREESDE